MTDETTRPTAQDIETVRAMVLTHLMSGLNKTPETVRQIAMLLDTSDRVFDYAAECMRAEEEGERVLEVAGAVGTPEWRKVGRARWVAYQPGRGICTLLAGSVGWKVWATPEASRPFDAGDRGSLAANIRAATASWNAAHPDLPPVVVPEQFREAPEVEAPEDAGDDGPDAARGEVTP